MQHPGLALLQLLLRWFLLLPPSQLLLRLLLLLLLLLLLTSDGAMADEHSLVPGCIHSGLGIGKHVSAAASKQHTYLVH
jgi:hypothetical protein